MQLLLNPNEKNTKEGLLKRDLKRVLLTCEVSFGFFNMDCVSQYVAEEIRKKTETNPFNDPAPPDNICCVILFYNKSIILYFILYQNTLHKRKVQKGTPMISSYIRRMDDETAYTSGDGITVIRDGGPFFFFLIFSFFREN